MNVIGRIEEIDDKIFFIFIDLFFVLSNFLGFFFLLVLVFKNGEIKFFEDIILLMVLDLSFLNDVKSGEMVSIVFKVLFVIL